MDNIIKSIAGLKCYSFLVDDYQRGYKWTKIEVEQLLNDIAEFKAENGSFYCLQPIVVKKRLQDGKTKIELIDGQQRLTTIYILFSYLEEETYSIEYKTRTSSTSFLNDEIKQFKNETLDWSKYIKDKTNYDNIDNYHFFTAYQTIKEWFKGKDDDFKACFKAKLKDKVQVIWYEVPLSVDNKLSKQESIKRFTQLNNGNIQLTNAELIKALFLINVGAPAATELLKLKQNEVAQQWDSIEYALQNDAFWYFLSNEKPMATRIEFIFDLIQQKPQNTQDKLFTFLKYNEDFAKNPDKMNWVASKWKIVYNTFLTLQEWYEDRKLYHLIGFLVCSKIHRIADLHKEYTEKAAKITKKGWIDHIYAKIKGKIQNYNLDEIKFDKNNTEINYILLLYNIETELKNNASNSKYPFDRHKQEQWSLEHLHAQNQKELTKEHEIVKYVNDFIKYIEGADDIDTKTLNDLKLKLDVTKPFDAKNFHLFIAEAKRLMPDLHSLDNMALLSGRLNSSLGNGFFNEKRVKIIENDKKGDFIPICTKNVFLKYYSTSSTTNLFYWSSEDRKNYLDDIKTTLQHYDLKTTDSK